MTLKVFSTCVPFTTFTKYAPAERSDIGISVFSPSIFFTNKNLPFISNTLTSPSNCTLFIVNSTFPTVGFGKTTAFSVMPG